jgi:hypothetical protein
MLDRSFGFETAVETAQAAIVSAVTEASCNIPNGIGIVKVSTATELCRLTTMLQLLCATSPRFIYRVYL